MSRLVPAIVRQLKSSDFVGISSTLVLFGGPLSDWPHFFESHCLLFSREQDTVGKN